MSRYDFRLPPEKAHPGSLSTSSSLFVSGMEVVVDLHPVTPRTMPADVHAAGAMLDSIANHPYALAVSPSGSAERALVPTSATGGALSENAATSDVDNNGEAHNT